MSYVSSIWTGCLFFPIIAFLITIPYILFQYHKYGSIHILRVIIIYSFILYLMIAYFLIILPLPKLEEVSLLTTPYTQLIPLNFIKDIIFKVNLDKNFFFNSEVYQVLYNLVLTIPFGIYLKYYFKFSLKKTIIYTFLLSLFFELTQLSGLYFIYPRPYRLFDVDDLIINTTGGLIGYYLAKPFTFFLPTREELDISAYKLGKKISTLKRFTSLCLDIMFLILISLLLTLINTFLPYKLPTEVITILVLLINYVLIPTFKNGQTLAKKIVNIRIVSLGDNMCKWYQYLIRYFFLYLFIFGFPYFSFYLINNIGNILPSLYSSIFIIIYIIFIFILFLNIVINNIFKKKLFLYERISKTKNISTIKIPEELK